MLSSTSRTLTRLSAICYLTQVATLVEIHGVSAKVAGNHTKQRKREDPMDTQIVVVYCFCDDVLKRLHHYEDRQRKMSDAEIITTSIVAALYFGGNLESARVFLLEHGYIPKMLEKSRFNRRMHKISDLFLVIFNLLGEVFKQLNSESIYVIDSFPIPACDNYRNSIKVRLGVDFKPARSVIS